MSLKTETFGNTHKITTHVLVQEGPTHHRGDTAHRTPAQTHQATEVAGLIAAFIDKAQYNVHIAIYDFRLDGPAKTLIIDALNGRAQAGCSVRIAYHQPKGGRTVEGFAWIGSDPAPDGTAGFLRDGMDPRVKLRAITDTAELAPPVEGEPINAHSQLMHNKYILRDVMTPRAAVLTGSSNLTNDAFSLQDNNIVILEDAPGLVRFYENDFGELWDSADIRNSGRDDTGNVEIDGLPVHVAFAPGQGRAIDAEIAARIAAAQSRLVVACMVISSGTVLGAIADRIHRVDNFKGIADGSQMHGVVANWSKLREPAAGAAARSRPRANASSGKLALFEEIAPFLHFKHSLPFDPANPQAPHEFMHNKFAVCDDLVITGSFNFSVNATRNAENVVMIRSPDLADAYERYADTLLARYPDRGLSGGAAGISPNGTS